MDEVIFRGRGGLKLAADAHGDPGARPVVFLHGGGQTRHAWSGAAEAVAAEGFRAYTIDLRGHGDSDRAPDGDYSSQAFEDDVIELSAQLPAPPVMVGASLGGLSAMGAHARSERPVGSALVMVDITPRLEVDGVRRIVGFMAARPEGFASLDEAADVIAAYLPHRPRPRDTSGLQKNLRLGADGRYRWHWDPVLMRHWQGSRHDPEEAERLLQQRLARARSIRLPTLLIRGRMSDIVSVEGAREFLDAVPHASYLDLEAAGHMVAGDRNDAFTRGVLDFLRGLPPL